jgi:hypothetical protein
MKNKATIIVMLSLLGITATFSAYLIKKAYIDKGFKKDKEHDTYLMLYILSLGLPYNEENINKYFYMTTEELKYNLEQIEDEATITGNEEFFNR